MSEKAHKGTIENWFKTPCGDHGLGYLIQGTSVDHPQFAGKFMHTSYVVKHEGNEIETRNSRYTLGKPALCEAVDDPVEALYRSALDVIDGLMTVDPEPGTPLSRLLNDLTDAVVKYEHARFGMERVHDHTH